MPNKVIGRTNVRVDFKSVRPGEMFEFNGEIFMKIVHPDLTMKRDDQTWAINLTYGRPMSFTLRELGFDRDTLEISVVPITTTTITSGGEP